MGSYTLQNLTRKWTKANCIQTFSDVWVGVRLASKLDTKLSKSKLHTSIQWWRMGKNKPRKLTRKRTAVRCNEHLSKDLSKGILVSDDADCKTSADSSRWSPEPSACGFWCAVRCTISLVPRPWTRTSARVDCLQTLTKFSSRLANRLLSPSSRSERQPTPK